MPTLEIAHIRRAAQVLEPHVVRTPLLSSPVLDAELGFNLFVKAECLQTTGSFKLRGALNKVLSLEERDRVKGIITFSAGNHGQAVAAAAKRVGCRSIIVLPNNAPKIKIERCRWWGADIVLYDPVTENREHVTKDIAEKNGMTLIHPFDDPEVMAGQGTAGLEIVDQLSERGVRPDVLVVNCSGGGLASGVVTAMAHFPDISIYLTEIAGFEKWSRALVSRQAERSEPVAKTIMDGINGPVVGTRPLATILEHKSVRTFGVDDTAAARAMRSAFDNLKVVLEPAGAASLAAVTAHSREFQGKNVVIIASGGNVDPAIFKAALDPGYG